jgi:hypothetical protein
VFGGNRALHYMWCTAHSFRISSEQTPDFRFSSLLSGLKVELVGRSIGLARNEMATKNPFI